MSVPNVSLGEISTINPKGPARGEIGRDEVLDFVPMVAVSEKGHMDVTESRAYSDVSKGFTAFKRGDVLVAKITPCYENNKIAKSTIETSYGFGSTEFHVIRTNTEALDPDYLTHFLRQDYIRTAGERRMTGSGGQRRVPKSFLEELKIPLPSLEEQKRIAGILDQADALRRLRTHALGKLNTLGQAIFHEMFGNRFQEANLSSLEPLGSYLQSVTNGMTRRAKSGDAQTEVVLRLKDIREGVVDFSEVGRIALTEKEKGKYQVNTGDLLFVRVNGNPEYVGRNSVFEGFSEPVHFNDHIMRVIVDKKKVCPEFLSFVLNSRFGKKQIKRNMKTSAGQHTINQAGLSAIRIPFPDIKLQNEFNDRITEVRRNESIFKQHLTDLDTLFSSLQHRAFRGEL